MDTVKAADGVGAPYLLAEGSAPYGRAGRTLGACGPGREGADKCHPGLRGRLRRRRERGFGRRIWWPARLACTDPVSDAGVRNEAATQEAGAR